MTVTNPIRGSFSLGISSARISRNSSETRLGRVPSGIGSLLGLVERELGLDHLYPGLALDEALDLVHDPLQVISLGGDGRHGDRGPLPEILMVDLRDRDVELRAKPGRERLHHVSLLLQGPAPGDPEVAPLERYQHGTPPHSHPPP